MERGGLVLVPQVDRPPFLAQYCLIVSGTASDREYEGFKPKIDLRRDAAFPDWTNRSTTLSSSAASLQQAAAVAEDGRRMKDLQFACAPISVRSMRDNVSTIGEHLVLLAEIDKVHIGFCISSLGLRDKIRYSSRSSQLLQMRNAEAQDWHCSPRPPRWPRRNIALATQGDNVAERSLTEQFARSIGAGIRRG
jgi:hypothetical protein